MTAPTPGSTVLASDFVTINGATGPLNPYPDSASCADLVSAVFGVGFGDFGYGQTIPDITNPQVASTITGVKWNALQNSIQYAAVHQATIVSNLPSAESLLPGQLITATGYDWTTAAQDISTNRLNADPSTMSLAPSVLTSQRTTDWSTSIEHVFTANFGVENSARYFFNSGGQIRIRVPMTAAGSPNARSQAWKTMMDQLGTINFDAHTTSKTGGSGGTTTNKGYYELDETPGNWTLIYTQDVAVPYAGNGIRIYVKREDIENLNGGNGSKLIFWILLDDPTGTPSDPVQGTFQSNVDVYSAASSIVLYDPDKTTISVASPNLFNVTLLDGGSGPTYWEYTKTITGTVYNYDILQDAQVLGYPGNVPIYFTLINNGTLLSSDIGYYALSCGQLPAGGFVTVINNSYIVGKGGAGGTGAPSGVCGCIAGDPGGLGGPAMGVYTGSNVKLLNYGVIGGGGGGGGGGGAECGYIWNSAAGGGGGGAGYGEAGQVNNCGVTAGRVGQPGGVGLLVTGGAGGAPGNIYTAYGGSGGDLGNYGAPGQSVSASGGAGAAPGKAIQGVGLLLNGSYLGDLRGSSI